MVYNHKLFKDKNVILLFLIPPDNFVNSIIRREEIESIALY